MKHWLYCVKCHLHHDSDRPCPNCYPYVLTYSDRLFLRSLCIDPEMPARY